MIADDDLERMWKRPSPNLRFYPEKKNLRIVAALA
jgi:hypothetical protein